MRKLRPIIAIILLPPYLLACTTWRVQNKPLTAVVAENPSKIRITQTNGVTTVVRQPAVSADSLFGIMPFGRGHPLIADTSALGSCATPAEDCTLEEWAGLSLSDVARVETQSGNAGPVIFAAIILIVGLGMAVMSDLEWLTSSSQR